MKPERIQLVDGMFAVKCSAPIAQRKPGGLGTTPFVFDPAKRDATMVHFSGSAWRICLDPPKHLVESRSLIVRRVTSESDLHGLGFSLRSTIEVVLSDGTSRTASVEDLTDELQANELGELLTGLDDLTPEDDDEPEGEGDTEPDSETPPDPDPEPNGDAADGDDDPPPPKAPAKKTTPRRRRRTAAKKD